MNWAPGIGKSALTDGVGSRLAVPVFAAGWLLGAMAPFSRRHLDDLMDIGAELLTTLAVRQPALGQSAILNHPSENMADRERWRSLARRADAEFVAAHCVCSDPVGTRPRIFGPRPTPGRGRAPNIDERPRPGTSILHNEALDSIVWFPPDALRAGSAPVRRYVPDQIEHVYAVSGADAWRAAK